MITVKIGQKFATKDFKTGESNGRKWAMVRAKAEKGYDEITLWTGEIEDAETQELISITSMTKSARKSKDKDGNEKWYDTYSANAIFKASRDVAPAIPSGFARVEDEEIPF